MHLSVELRKRFRQALRRLRAALGIVSACALAGAGLSSAHAASCVGNSNALCFAPEHPASNQHIDVMIVIGSVVDPYYCLRDLSRTIDGRRIHYEAVFDDCGDKTGEPLVTILPLGPLAPGAYDVTVDAPTSPSAPDPASGPLSLRATLIVGEAVDASESTPFAVEFHRVAADHYFVTTSAAEINKLDRGEFAGWVRTGESFAVLSPDTPIAAARSPVCRFYGPARSRTRFAFLLGVARRMRGRARALRECVDPGIGQRLRRDAARGFDRHLRGRHAARLSTVQPSGRRQSSTDDVVRSADPR
jgi:hypothetical protein